jgi:hypothetical protein
LAGWTRHAIASKASGLWFEKADTPMLIPPSGGLLSRPSTTFGYFAAAMLRKTVGAFCLADGWTKG